MEGKITEFGKSVVDVEDLSVSFSGQTVLDRVNFSIRPGRITMILGPSGCGKSTLLRAINRLNEFYPDCRTEGSVRLNLEGRCGDVYNDFLSLPELRRKVGMVFQTPNVLPFSIEKNLTLPVKVTLGLPKKLLTERMEWALREVALWDEVKDRLRKNAPTLSGGQQQRLCLARVLALEPRILLLDEPTASLDFRATRQIEQLLSRLKDRYPILAVSHSLGQTRRLADHVYVLRKGKIIRELNKAHLEDAEIFQELIEDIF